jgi:hypothetical protein
VVVDGGQLGDQALAGRQAADDPCESWARLIDRALAEPDPDRRAAMWTGIDQRIMGDAPSSP